MHGITLAIEYIGPRPRGQQGVAFVWLASITLAIEYIILLMALLWLLSILGTAQCQQVVIVLYYCIGGMALPWLLGVLGMALLWRLSILSMASL